MHPQKFAHRHVSQKVHILGELGYQLLSGIAAQLSRWRLVVDENSPAGRGVAKGELLNIGNEGALA
jgi:hypothetical protein